MTITHEFAHFITLIFLGFELARTFECVEIYEDPEWQAKCLAGELMMPASKIKKMSIKEIQEHYHVTEEAAKIQKKHS